MKKFILLAALAIGAMSAQAAVSVEGSKFFDNMSLTLKGGAVSPAKGHGFWKNARGIFGLELRKQITPVVGVGIEGEATINTSDWTGVKSKNVIDASYVGAFGTINFNNLFAGYAGAPRVFEIEGVIGAGWIHGYWPKAVQADYNSWGTKAGLNLNFNLGATKAWTIAIKPSVLWNMGANTIARNQGGDTRYDLRYAYVEMEAGVTYHFKNSNGTHSFKVVVPMDEELIASLNAEINSLRAQLDACGADNAALLAQIAAIQAELDACLARPAVVKEVVKNLDNVRYVFFKQGSAVIEPTQAPNVEMVAQQLKDNDKATVTVKGYASPEGSLAFNEKLAQKRADAVKNALVNTYGIAADRVDAQGEGVGSVFSEKTWNRVAIATVNL